MAGFGDPAFYGDRWAAVYDLARFDHDQRVRARAVSGDSAI